MKKNRNSRGFTILELIIVMAILAILILMAMPMFQKYIVDAKETSELGSASTLYKASALTVLEKGSGGKKVSYNYDGIYDDILDGVAGDFTADDMFIYMYKNDEKGSTDVGANRNVYPDRWWIYFLVTDDGQSYVIPNGAIYIIAPSGNVYRNGVFDDEMTDTLGFVKS